MTLKTRLSGLILALLLMPIAATQAQTQARVTSLCDIAAAPARYDGKTVTVEAHLFVNYHATYLYSHSCTRPEFGFDQKIGGSSDAAARLRKRLQDTNLFIGDGSYGDYYVKFTGAFHRLNAEQRTEAGRGMAGYFVISDVAVLVPEARRANEPAQ